MEMQLFEAVALPAPPVTTSTPAALLIFSARYSAQKASSEEMARPLFIVKLPFPSLTSCGLGIMLKFCAVVEIAKVENAAPSIISLSLFII